VKRSLFQNSIAPLDRVIDIKLFHIVKNCCFAKSLSDKLYSEVGGQQCRPNAIFMIPLALDNLTARDRTECATFGPDLFQSRGGLTLMQ